MLILGFNGGGNLVHEEAFDLEAGASHDAAAVLIEDGEVVAGIEQERLDRIKHSNKFPVEAIQFCLDQRGAKLSDLDAVAYYTTKTTMDLRMKQQALKLNLGRGNEPRYTKVEDFFRDLFAHHLGADLPPERLHFVNHHVTHVVSAFACSGFDRALVLSIDGVGEGESGRVAVGEGTSLETLRVIRQDISLGHFYDYVIHFLGFKMFDEYKAMGLAPYGDPSRFRAEFKRFYELLPGGVWATNPRRLYRLFEVMEPRKKGEPFEQVHKDVAAALQEALEAMVFHALRHFQKETGEKRLCLAGGVAHNCTMNGKIAAAKIFDEIFVQPAAHDAGCALGAALSLHYRHRDRAAEQAAAAAGAAAALNVPGFPRLSAAGTRALRKLADPGAKPAAKAEPAAAAAEPPPPRPSKLATLDHLYWGTDVSAVKDTGAELARWSDFLTIERHADIEARTAALLAGGSAIGWVQGKSEFGPRALGNRSILADPRPAENKQIINAMVKKREGFRPFAPSVLEEDAGEYFDLFGMKNTPFMIFVVDVREDKRALLGAVTHVNGSARVQTVSKKTNPRYWTLINEFKKLTGCAVLLNTSFNNNAEPIVDSIEDGVVSFLTTNLHYLVVNDFIAAKKDVPLSTYRRLVPSLPRWAKLNEVRRFAGTDDRVECFITTNAEKDFKKDLSQDAFEILLRADGKATLGDLIDARGLDEKRGEALLTEMQDLWSWRVVVLAPGAKA
jgi:carbamoyltransferase